MNGSAQIKGFEADTWINGIGDLFRKKDGVKWGINLSIWPRKEAGFDAVSLSNAPILVRKNIINSTKEYRRNGYEKTFTVTSSHGWRVERLDRCPARERQLSKESQQLCFVFSLKDGTRIFLPQFELARALFFHNGYLARSSVLHDVLNNEFAVEYDDEDGRGIINVLETCNCPSDLFNDHGYRRVLAWLLMDADARRSYDSIGNYQLRDGKDRGQYRYWTFQFIPPELRRARIKVKGHFDSKSQALLVYEIESIRNIPVSLPDHIEFFSNKFATQVEGRGQSAGAGADRPPSHSVDDDAEGSRENKPVMISGVGTEFEFARAVETSKISRKRKPIGRGGADEGELTEAPGDVSTDEQGPYADLPSAEWDKLDEQTDDAHLYLNKFTSYFEMLKLLQKKHGCQVSRYPLRKLPAVGKCKRHILANDGKPRCLSVVHVTVNKVGYYLLEVDTSDAKKALSTKVILASSIGGIEQHLCEIEKQLLKASLSWPKAYLDHLVGTDNHSWMAHQKSDKGGYLTEVDVSKWAERVRVKLLLQNSGS